MPARRVLVVEDDPAIREGLCDALRFEGYAVEAAVDAPQGESLGLRAPIDLVLLDLMLPGGDGFSVLRSLRAARPRLPVIILTAKGREADRVEGLKLGADDYVVKPFSVLEVLARVEAVLRRSAERPLDLASIQLPDGVVDLERCELRFDDGERHPLPDRELSLLRYLALQGGRAVSRDELLERVWRLNASAVHTRTVDMHVARLRAKLRDPEGQLLRTVRGKGYLFELP